MKFGDVVMATASASVVYVLLRAVIGLALAASYSGHLATGITSFIVGGLVAGYVFAGKIREESRMRSIAKIIVLFALVNIFVSFTLYSTIGHYHDLADETLSKMYNTSSWTNTDWFDYEVAYMYLTTGGNTALAMVFGFIALYIGSVLKKPKKS